MENHVSIGVHKTFFDICYVQQSTDKFHYAKRPL